MVGIGVAHDQHVTRCSQTLRQQSASSVTEGRPARLDDQPLA
jgi:hypothetical protein